MTERIDILINARNQASPAIEQVKTSLKGIDDAAATLNRGLIGVGAIAGIGAVVQGLQQIGQAIDEVSRRGAIFQQLQDVQEDYARSVGATADAFLEAGRKAAQGTIADFDLILNANRAIQFQVASTADGYAKLIELSTALGRAQGITDTQALDFITRGIARRSALILDNLGLFIDLDKTEKEYAQSLGKTVSQLSAVERNQAILNEAFRQGQTAIEANRDAADSAATNYERLDANVQNLKDAFGELAAAAGTGVIAGLAVETAKLTELLTGDRKASTIELQIRGLVKARDELAKTEPVTVLGFEVSDNSFLINKWTEEIALLEKELNDLKFPLTDMQQASELSLQAADAYGEYQRALQKRGNRQALEEINELEKALEDVPAQLDNLVRARLVVDAEVDTSDIDNELGRINVDALRLAVQAKIEVEPISTEDLTRRVNEYKDEFQALEKLQESTRQRLANNAVNASDVIGDTKAFELFEQQYADAIDRINALGVSLFNEEISSDQFLFELSSIPGEVGTVFDDINAAAGEGAEKLQERLRGLFDLRDALQLNVEITGNTGQLDAINSQIQQLESALGIINPAALRAAQGLEAIDSEAARADAALASVVSSAGGGGVAMEQFANDAASANAEVGALVGVLGAAPAALANLANAAIAAGANVSVVAAQVSGLRAEFLALESATAGVRRSILSRAASVSDIVGDSRALNIATEQIAGLESSTEALGQQLYAGTITAEEYEYQLAKLDQSFTGVFDDIEEADRKSKSLAKTVGGDLNQAFSNLQSKVSSVLSGALNVDVGVDTNSLLPREDAINEDARRLADVAVNGWSSPWASYLSQKFPDLIGKAFEGGGDVKQTAARILRDFEDGLVPQLIDKDTAKDRVRRALLGEANSAALAKEIASELAAEFGGQFSAAQISATAGVTLGVSGAESEQLASTLTGAATGVQERLSGLGDSLKTGIVSALDGLGEAVGNALDKQLRSEGSLKQIRSAGYDSGLTWGDGFLESMDELSGLVLEKLAKLVSPYVEGVQNTNAQLTGAN